jgi:hypothetical protein
MAKTKYQPIADILRIYGKLLNYRYVDEPQKYKTHRIMKFLGRCPPIKLTKIIADTI